MKNFTLSFFILFIGSLSHGQITITHNNSQTVVANNGITCAHNGTGITLYNRYFGVFDLAKDFGIIDDWTIESIEVGIEDARNIPNDLYPIYIKLYTSDDGTPNGNLTLLGGDTLLISLADELTVVSMALSDPVVAPAGEILVVELEVFGDTESIFRLGSTNIESNDDSWGHAPECGFTIPISYTDAGFLNAWNIINVIGESTTVGIEENIFDHASVYPNPNNGIVNIKLPTSYEVFASNLYDLSGKDTGVKIIEGVMNTANIVKGIYILRVKTSEGTLVQKIIKE